MSPINITFSLKELQNFITYHPVFVLNLFFFRLHRMHLKGWISRNWELTHLSSSKTTASPFYRHLDVSKWRDGLYMVSSLTGLPTLP